MLNTGLCPNSGHWSPRRPRLPAIDHIRAMSNEARTLRTRTADLKKTEDTERKSLHWGQAEVTSNTLFIVEGTEGPTGLDKLQTTIAANFSDALAARASLGRSAGDLYLFTRRDDEPDEAPVYGKIREVTRVTPEKILITLESGATLYVALKSPRAAKGSTQGLTRLYSSHGDS